MSLDIPTHLIVRLSEGARVLAFPNRQIVGGRRRHQGAGPMISVSILPESVFR
jgi:hypothetical protein